MLHACSRTFRRDDCNLSAIRLDDNPITSRVGRISA